jgi:hypothetical protein
MVKMIMFRRLGWMGHVAHWLEIRTGHNILVMIPYGKIPFGQSMPIATLNWKA